jgi:predicted branched-subunit amino acid permease
MLVNFRLVLISTMMIDLQHHHGVWKTLAIFTVG